MLGTDLMLAQDSVFVFPWYNWVLIVGIIVVLIAYKIYKDKTMT